MKSAQASVLQAARRRKAQQEFLARGRASLAKATETGEFYPLTSTLDEMQVRLEKRMSEHRHKKRSGKP